MFVILFFRCQLWRRSSSSADMPCRGLGLHSRLRYFRTTPTIPVLFSSPTYNGPTALLVPVHPSPQYPGATHGGIELHPTPLEPGEEHASEHSLTSFVVSKRVGRSGGMCSACFVSRVGRCTNGELDTPLRHSCYGRHTLQA